MGNSTYCLRGAAPIAALVASLLVTQSNAQTAVPPPSGLVSWWALDGNTRDYGTRGLDGTLVGPGSFTAARVLAGYRPGGAGSCMSVPDNAVFDVSRSFTYEGWVRVDGLAPAHSYFLDKGSAVHRNTPYAIGVVGSSGTFPVTPGASTTGIAAAGRLFVVVSDNDLEQAVFSARPFLLGAFTHFAVTVTPTASGQTRMAIYQNGIETGVAFLGRLPFNGTGALQVGGIAGGTGTLDGVLDEITLYDRALSPAEVASIFNAGAAGKVKPRFDVTPPVVTIDQPVTGAIVGNRTVMVNATVVDESPTVVSSQPGGVSASLGAGGGFARGDVVLTGPDGDATIVVTAVDTGDLRASASVTLTLDTTQPSVNVSAPGEGTILGNAEVSLVIEVSDLTATRVEIAGDRRDLPAGGGAVLMPVVLVPGANAILVVVTDAAGNRTEVVRNLVLDLDAPMISILAPADGALFGAGASAAALSVRVDDLGPTTVGSQPAGLAGSLPASGGVLTGTIPLSEGLNTLLVSATDSTNRTANASMTVNLDTTPPLAVFASPAPNALVRGTIDVRVGVTEVAPGSGIDGIQVFVDNTAIATQPSGDVAVALDTMTLSDGVHVLTAVARDGAGNEARVAVGIVVDNTAPTLAIVTPAADTRVSGRIRFEATAFDGGSGMVSLHQFVGGRAPTVDGSQEQSSPSSTLVAMGEEDTTRWPNGELTLRVTAADLAGNTAELEVDVLVDNVVLVPPVAPTLSPANGQVVRHKITLVATSQTTNFTRLELAVDGVVVGSSNRSPLKVRFDTTDRVDGPMTVEARITSVTGRSVTTHVLLVDNMKVDRIEPSLLDLGARSAPKGFVDITGPNLMVLAPLLRGGVELRVPGGSPVLCSVASLVRIHRCAHGFRLSFDRNQLAAAVQAGIAAGAIQPERHRVTVTVFAGGRELGAKTIQVIGHDRARR